MLAFLHAALLLGADETPTQPDPIKALVTYTYGQGETNLAAVERLVASAANDGQAAASIEARLLAVLDSKPPVEVSGFVCRQLRLIGSDLCVPALARLLTDPKLSHMARYALEPNPRPAAARALRQALPLARGAHLIGIINSLGARQEPESVPPLVALLAQPDADVAQATIAALGKIGGAQAAEALRDLAAQYDPGAAATGSYPPVKLSENVRIRLDGTIILNALLDCAWSFAKAGNAGAAKPLFERVYGMVGVPHPQRMAALRGLIEVSPVEAAPLVLALVQQDQPGLHACAASFVLSFPSTNAARIYALAEGLPPARQVLVIDALATGGDPAVLPLLLRATRHPDPHLVLTAVRGLGGLQGDAEAVGRLTQLAALGGEVAETARQSLTRMRGDEVDRALLEGTKAGATAERAEYLRAAGRRGMAAAAPSLIEALGDRDPAARLAALEALGMLASPGQVSVLLNRVLAAPTAAERAAAGRALAAAGKRTPDREIVVRSMIESFDRAPVEAKLILLECLGELGGPEALSWVCGVAKGADPVTRNRAFRVLSLWPDLTALDPLLALARASQDPATRTTALLAYLDLLDRLGRRTLNESADRYRQAFALVTTVEEKQRLLAGLVQVPHPDLLRLAESYLSDGSLKNDAAQVILRLASTVSGAAPGGARAAVDKVLAVVDNPELLAQAKATLASMEKYEDFVSLWRLAGPYAPASGIAETVLDQRFEPETPDGHPDWCVVAAREGRVSLDRFMGGQGGCFYLWACVVSPKPQPARLELVSTDGIKVWLNGKVVHLRHAPGTLANAEETVEIALNGGRNDLLLKVGQGVVEWAASCRVRAIDGGKVEGLQILAE